MYRRRRLNQKAVLPLSLLANALLLVLVLSLLLSGPLRRQEEPALTGVDTTALRDYAFDYQVSLEFLQRILPDYLIYQHRGEYVFEPLDDKQPRHAYDWTDLVYDEAGRILYEDENWPRACTGVDVSQFQGDIDWPAVAASGVECAFVRLGYRGYSQGALHEDDKAAANLKGAAAAGLKVGAYVFSQAISEEEAVAEAELALRVLNGRELQLPVAFDMEEIYEEAARTDFLSREEATELALAFCRRIEQGGYKAMIYGNTAWLSARLDRSRLQDYPVWLAQYNYRPLYPYEFAVWQYTAAATVPGISGEADLNICFDPDAL
ncbi:MAG: lysozyme [Firmicutes bacterium]|nr:lysozyme [Bacillota bacterium]